MHTPNRKCVNKYDLQDSLWMENIWKFFSRLIARACAISVTELFIPDTYLNISGLKQKRERERLTHPEGGSKKLYFECRHT
jgi:hypothetical protein